MTDWKEWKGGAIDSGPLPALTWCEILMLDGEVWGGFAETFNWSDLGDFGGNIVGYRVPSLADEPIKARYEAETKEK